MSIALIITGGFGNGTLAGDVNKVVTFGYTPGAIAPASTVGTLNIVHSFPTGQSDVTVTLYNLDTGATIALNTDAASEVGSTGIYVWNVANITTYPGVYTEYGYTMTDGATTESGKIWAPDPLAIHLVNDTILN